MKKKISLFIIILSFIVIPKVNASECNNSEILKVRSLASLIKFEIKYIGKQFDDEYGIYISNMNDRFYVYYKKQVYKNNSIITGLHSKSINDLQVLLYYGDECLNEFSYNRNITIPAYNEYYKSDICLNNRDISYCEITYDSSGFTEEQFNEMVNKYLDNQNQKPVEIEEKNNMYIYVIIGIALIAIVSMIVITNKRRKKAYF